MLSPSGKAKSLIECKDLGFGAWISAVLSSV